MRMKATVTAGFVILLGAGSAFAEPKIYPVHTAHNFCPAGLQPVTMDGTICCGKPNQSHSYSAMMTHGGKAKKRVMRAKAADCPIGVKGCS